MEYRSLDWMVGTMVGRLARFGEALFCGGELAECTEAVEKAFIGSGLLRPHTNTDCVPCPGCEEGCWVVPEWLTRFDGEQILRAFCDTREDIFMVEIEPDHLRQWRADLETVGTLFRQQVPLAGQPRFVVPERLYLAGHRRIKGTLTRLYVASDGDAALEQHLSEGPAVVVTLTRPVERSSWRRRGVRLVPLEDLVYAEDGQVFLDSQTVLGGSREPAPAAPTVAPLDLPSGCSWEQVYLRFLDRYTVEVKVGRFVERRTFETLGMTDSRCKLVEPDQQWALLRVLADTEGSLGWGDPGAGRKQRGTMMRLRQRLRDVFGIEEDPIKDYRKERKWETRFRVYVQEEPDS